MYPYHLPSASAPPEYVRMNMLTISLDIRIV